MVKRPFALGHMEKQETEMKWKLVMDTGNGNGNENAPITGAMFSSPSHE